MVLGIIDTGIDLLPLVSMMLKLLLLMLTMSMFLVLMFLYIVDHIERKKIHIVIDLIVKMTKK